MKIFFEFSSRLFIEKNVLLVKLCSNISILQPIRISEVHKYKDIQEDCQRWLQDDKYRKINASDKDPYSNAKFCALVMEVATQTTPPPTPRPSPPQSPAGSLSTLCQSPVPAYERMRGLVPRGDGWWGLPEEVHGSPTGSTVTLN